MYNHTGLQGRLTADPELRHTPSGVAITSFRLASDTGRKTKDGQKITNFIDHRLLCPLLRQQEGRGRRRPSGHRRRLRRLPGQLRRLHRGGRQWGLAILNDRRATGGRPKTSQRHATA